MKCECCRNEHDGIYGSGRFCSATCARRFSTINKRAEINLKVSAKLTGRVGNKQTEKSIKKRQKTLLERYGTTNTFSLCDEEKRTKNRTLYYKNRLEAFLRKPFEELSLSQKKKKLIYDLDGKCSFCKNNMWLNKPIKLELDHINGDRSNNTKDNLRILCPNCHSTTDTYKSSNDKKKSITNQQILDAVTNLGTISKALKSLGLNPTAGNYKRASRLIQVD